MYRRPGSYLSATRHPWPCLVFLAPLMAAYEAGVAWLGGAQPETLRNGADSWLHSGLQALGLPELYWLPAGVAGLLVLASWLRRYDRPSDVLGICLGMTIESVVFALGLWGLSRSAQPLLKDLGTKLASITVSTAEPAQIIRFVGAGIYEEVLFRLLLFQALVWLLRRGGSGPTAAFLLAALASAVAFSSAHHIGPGGEPFNASFFIFRAAAGVYFALLYQLRGFGVAVGAHALYDVLVGTLLPPHTS